MKKELMLAVAAGSLLFSSGVAYSASTLMQIGRSPFHRPPLASVTDLQEMVQHQAADLQKGFEKAGYPQLYQPFMEQIGSVAIEKLDFPKGTHFEWMFFKRKGSGVVRVVRDLFWGNDVPFPAYAFAIIHDGRQYNMAVPLGCGNVALLGVEDVETIEIVVNQAPVCRASVTPVKTYWGENITIDASSSSDADGRVVGMEVVVTDSNGKTVEQEIVDNSLTLSLPLVRGAKSVEVFVVDDAGDSATSDACMVDVQGQSRVNVVGDVGVYRMFDPGTWVFGRMGVEYIINDNWSVLGMVGLAPHVGGDDGKRAVMFDLLGQYRIDRFFVHLGVGAWMSSGDNDRDTEDDDMDIIAGMGYRIYGEEGDFNTSLFTELRSAVDEMDEISDYGRFGAGLRFRF